MTNKNYKILLVDPTSIHHGPPVVLSKNDSFINKKYVDRINEVVNKRCPDNMNKALHSSYITNYGLLMFASILKNDYETVDYINGDYFEKPDDYLNYLKNVVMNYDLISLTSTTPQFNEVKKIASMIKENYPDKRIILGGPHTRYYLTHDVEDVFDTVCIGYGLDKSKEVVDKYSNSQKVDKKVISDYYFDAPKDFSIIPSDKINNTMLYSYINFGCPNNCDYCVEHKFVDKIAFNNCEIKFDEIRSLVKDYGVKFVHIADSDFLMFGCTVEKFIDFVKKEKLNFCFSINTSPITISKYDNSSIIKELVDIGLVEILIGAEHFSSKVLDGLSKKYDINKFSISLALLKYRDNVPVVSLYTLVGLPFEYHDDIQKNLDVINVLKEKELFDFTFPKFFVPYPDSEVYLHPEKYGVIIKNENWDEYQRWQLPRPIIINGMEDQDYIDEINEIYKIVLKENKRYEDNSHTSLCKKRQQNLNGAGE